MRRRFHQAPPFAAIGFTQKNALEELVRAAEGVPRDAMNIIGLCAQAAAEGSIIAIGHMRHAAKIWYEPDKEEAVQAHPDSARLLHWIIEKVIGHRRTRTFLLQTGTREELIERLSDARVLHQIFRLMMNRASGMTFTPWTTAATLTCLLAPARAPEGMLPTDELGYVEVPPDDYRGIRRAIFSLEPFREANTAA